MEKGYTIKCLNHGFVRYIDHMGTDTRICEAARLSYQSPSKGEEQDKKLLFYLYKMRHTSPFEQCNITFNIKLPLFVQGQMVRHRTQRLNQVSARYSEMSEEFYIPTKWRKQDTKNKQGSIDEGEFSPEVTVTVIEGFSQKTIPATQALMEYCDRAYELYQSMMQAGIAREMARVVLPQNLYTEIYSNWDLHNLMHFFKLRLDEHAQWEIRQYAKAMFGVFEELYPLTAEAYEKYKWRLLEGDNDIPHH